MLEKIDALEPKKRNMIFIHEDVRSHIENLKHDESISRQKKWFTEQIEKGNRTLDVLRKGSNGHLLGLNLPVIRRVLTYSEKRTPIFHTGYRT